MNDKDASAGENKRGKVFIIYFHYELSQVLNDPMTALGLSDLVDRVKIAAPVKYNKDVVIQAEINLTF